MKIGITGALGYIGSRVVIDSLVSKYEVVCIDNLSSNKIDEIPGIETENSDIKIIGEIESSLKDCDVIIHLAALPGLVNCKKNPTLAYEANVIGTQNITWICYKYNIPLIFISSLGIFGNPEKFPIEEDDLKNPSNLYTLTKLIGMKTVETFSKGNFPAYIFLLANVYGIHQIDGKDIFKDTVVNKFIKQANDKKPITVYSPGDQMRNFIHVSDVSRAISLGIKKISKEKEKKAILFNLADKSYRIKDIAKIISDSHSDAKIEVIPNPRTETYFKNYSVDTEKIKNYLNFEPKMELKMEVIK